MDPWLPKPKLYRGGDLTKGVSIEPNWSTWLEQTLIEQLSLVTPGSWPLVRACRLWLHLWRWPTSRLCQSDAFFCITNVTLYGGKGGLVHIKKIIYFLHHYLWKGLTNLLLSCFMHRVNRWCMSFKRTHLSRAKQVMVGFDETWVGNQYVRYCRSRLCVYGR